MANRIEVLKRAIQDYGQENFDRLNQVQKSNFVSKVFGQKGITDADLVNANVPAWGEGVMGWQDRRAKQIRDMDPNAFDLNVDLPKNYDFNRNLRIRSGLQETKIPTPVTPASPVQQVQAPTGDQQPFDPLQARSLERAGDIASGDANLPEEVVSDKTAPGNPASPDLNQYAQQMQAGEEARYGSSIPTVDNIGAANDTINNKLGVKEESDVAKEQRLAQAFYFTGLGLKQYQAGVGKYSPLEKYGGLLTASAGLSRFSQTDPDSMWSKMAPAVGVMGTVLNMIGQEETAKAERSNRRKFVNNLTKAVSFVDSL